jgi:NADPH:quinone reductase-like Zn-dependent oxidoreductase
MTNINKLVCESFSPALRPLGQAAIWGLTGLAAHQLTKDKKTKEMTSEEKKKNIKNALISAAAGGLAGFLGSKF